jgi:hypothetical protein
VTRLRRMSLFEFFSKSIKSVVPVLGVDFSDSNWSYCEGDVLHLENKNKPQIYGKLIKKFAKTIRFISIDHIYPYLFSCKVNPNSSSIPLYPFEEEKNSKAIELSEVFNKYYSVMKRVIHAQTVHHSKIFKNAGEIAEISDIVDLDKFVVYLHITPGVVDDYDETLEQLKEMHTYPISIIIVRIKDSNIDIKENINLPKLIQELSTFQNKKRKYISLLEIAPKAKDEAIKELMKKIRIRIIHHIESYLDFNRFEIANTIL